VYKPSQTTVRRIIDHNGPGSITMFSEKIGDLSIYARGWNLVVCQR
jgi:hypothetical protein